MSCSATARRADALPLTFGKNNLPLLLAIWRCKRGPGLLIPSDQGAQFTSRQWVAFLREHNLEHSMSRRSNCHDNSVAESFFQPWKQEKVRRRKYGTREEARRDEFEYIELFYNPKRKHTNNGMLSPLTSKNDSENS